MRNRSPTGHFRIAPAYTAAIQTVIAAASRRTLVSFRLISLMPGNEAEVNQSFTIPTPALSARQDCEPAGNCGVRVRLPDEPD